MHQNIEAGQRQGPELDKAYASQSVTLMKEAYWTAPSHDVFRVWAYPKINKDSGHDHYPRVFVLPLQEAE